MQYDRDEQLAFVRYGRLPRPPDGARPSASVEWRWRRRPPVVPPRPLAPDPALAKPAPLDIHEYLELEFAVGQESRR